MKIKVIVIQQIFYSRLLRWNIVNSEAIQIQGSPKTLVELTNYTLIIINHFSKMKRYEFSASISHGRKMFASIIKGKIFLFSTRYFRQPIQLFYMCIKLNSQDQLILKSKKKTTTWWYLFVYIQSLYSLYTKSQQI